MNGEGRSVLDGIEKETAGAPGAETGEHPRQENVEVGAAALADMLAVIEPLLGEALTMVPNALAKSYGDERFRLEPEEKESGQRIVGLTLKLYVDDLLKYAKALALVASVAWTASVAIPRFSLLGQLKRERMQAKRKHTGDRDPEDSGEEIGG